MAKIIENKRRMIRLSVDDVLNIVREYQRLTTNKACCYEHTREILGKNPLFLPEEIEQFTKLNNRKKLGNFYFE